MLFEAGGKEIHFMYAECFTKLLIMEILKIENVPHELIDLAKIFVQNIGSISSFSHVE